MANSLGQLVVSLGLDAADFTSPACRRARLQAQRFAQQLDRTVRRGIIKAELALRALGRGAGDAAATFQSLTDWGRRTSRTSRTAPARRPRHRVARGRGLYGRRQHREHRAAPTS
jgi:hypothetical protein